MCFACCVLSIRHPIPVLFKNKIVNKHKRKFNLLPKQFFGENTDEPISNPEKIANKFNEYFTNIGPSIAGKIPNTKKHSMNISTDAKTAFSLNQSLNKR